MLWREIVGPDRDADACIRAALTPREYADAREPGLTPDEMQALYGVDTEDDELDRDERRARIVKAHADARKINAEADRSEAEAAAHRAEIKRKS